MLSLAFSAKLLLLSVLLFSQCSSSNGNTPCVAKSYGPGRFVCVCNSTYCDDLDAVELPAKGQILVYTSNIGGSRMERSSTKFASRARRSVNDASTKDDESETAGRNPNRHFRLDVTRDTLPHKILGYGGAFTDAAGINIQDLPAAAQEKLIGSYFGSNGIGYSLGRVPMGGCDFSPRNYTYADTPGDPNLDLFRLQPEDHFYKIPYIKMAQAISPIKIRLYGSPWSAPPWMKTNNAYAGRGFLKPEYYQTWADYFVKFLESYDSVGLPFWGVTTQNEPFDGLVPHFPFNCMGWHASQQRIWIKTNLGPTLKRSKFSNLKVIIVDENTAALPHYPKEILEDKEAAEYVWGIGLHWYSTDMTTHEPVLKTHQLFPETPIMGTEACAGFLPWEPEKVILGSWDRGEYYAEDILQGIRNHVVGWTDWNLALNPEGGPNWAQLAADAAIIVNKTSGEFYKQPMFYALAHVAKFLLPGSSVVELGISPSSKDTLEGLSTAAVQRPDGSIALVILNRRSHAVELTVVDTELGELTHVVGSRTIQTLVYNTRS